MIVAREQREVGRRAVLTQPSESFSRLPGVDLGELSGEQGVARQTPPAAPAFPGDSSMLRRDFTVQGLVRRHEFA